MSKPPNNIDFDDELLSAYVDGELTDVERAMVEARLKNDPAARELIVEIQALSSTLRSLPKHAATEDVRSAVLGHVPDKHRVNLPAYRQGPLRRIMWPAIAIAAALFLIFTQDEGKKQGEVAKLEVRGGELRDQPTQNRDTLAFDAPVTLEAETPTVATAIEPTTEEIAVLTDGATAGVAIRAQVPAQPALSAGSVVDAIATGSDELGIVHLTLTDLRTGTERFDRLLLSNGVQVLDDLVDADRVSGMAGSFAADSASAAVELNARTLAASPARGGGTSGAAPIVSISKSSEPEMVLVEAPPKQIEQILYGCSNDTAAIEAVAIDPSASATNLAPTRQRLRGYQQYNRTARSPSDAKGYKITPEQQGVISVLNSLSTPDQDGEPQPATEPAAGSLQQQGWAAKFRGGGELPEPQQLEAEVNNRRSQFFGNERKQQTIHADEKFAKNEAATEQPMRVLFLLHPSEESAAKK